jgi:hypothetical protein
MGLSLTGPRWLFITLTALSEWSVTSCSLVAGHPGDRFTMIVGFHAGRRHLPIGTPREGSRTRIAAGRSVLHPERERHR